MRQDQKITRELDRYRLADPSPGLHDRVLRAGNEAWQNSDIQLPWTGRWLNTCASFRQEMLAFVSVILLILGAGMQLAESQSVLADSIERLTIMAAVSESLNRATSMDCTVIKRGTCEAGSRYRIRWDKAGITRVDIDSIHHASHALWISDEAGLNAVPKDGPKGSPLTSTMPSECQLPGEFLTPAALARQMERYGLTQDKRLDDAQPNELQLSGRDGSLAVTLFIDAMTGLPKKLKKYRTASTQTSKSQYCSEEVQFQWNEPIPRELFVHGMSAVTQQAH